jgi:hypothetical protein
MPAQPPQNKTHPSPNTLSILIFFISYVGLHGLRCHEASPDDKSTTKPPKDDLHASHSPTPSVNITNTIAAKSRRSPIFLQETETNSITTATKETCQGNLSTGWCMSLLTKNEHTNEQLKASH